MNHKELAHAWAHENVEYRSSGNLIADGDTIYSYGRHFAIARRLPEGGRIRFLLTTATASNSTSKQTGYVRQAMFGRVVAVHNPRANSFTQHAQNLIDIIKQANEELEAAKRSRKYTTSCLGRALTRVDDYREYRAQFFGRRSPERYLNKEDKKLHRAFMQDKRFGEIDLPALRAEEARERELIDAKKIELNKRFIAEWKACERDTVPFLNKTFLRRKGDSVQTSLGVTIPIVIGLGLYRKILRSGVLAIDEDKKIVMPFTEAKIHDFGYGSNMTIFMDASIRIGCHRIEWDEIDSLAEQLGFKSAPEVEMTTNLKA